MKIYFESSQLFENTENKLKVAGIFEIILKHENGVVRILDDGYPIIQQEKTRFLIRQYRLVRVMALLKVVARKSGLVLKNQRSTYGWTCQHQHTCGDIFLNV